MRFLIITQFYYPDTVALGQHLYDLSATLTGKGHQVHVITSGHAYENMHERYLRKETINGVRVSRLRNTAFGKSTIMGRATDIISFDLLLLWKLLFMRKKGYDIVIGMTSPPFTSFISGKIARAKKIKFVYWAMDLQPELSIASGLLSEKNILAKLLLLAGLSIFRKADSIIVLDKYMKQYLLSKGIHPRKISVIPLWPIMERVYEGEHEENPFRIAHQFTGKIVIMYSGNHSFVHPLDTLLGAALGLKDHLEFLFVFIGEGVKKKQVSDFKLKNKLQNIIQLPFQPIESIHLSLGAADVHVVILGEGQVGFTHPGKIYGAMFIGKPIIYIGPAPSHITDMLAECEGNIIVAHNTDKLVAELISFSNSQGNLEQMAGNINRVYACRHFDPGLVKNKIVEMLEKCNLKP